MIDELTLKRQQKCAESKDGHSFTQVTHGTCTKCLLRINPPVKKKPKVKINNHDVCSPDTCGFEDKN